jgi:hypothetical protein
MAAPPRPIEIIGGGLAGLSLGLALRRAGVPVTLFEAGEYPRHRVCGEFIAGLGDGTAQALGLTEFLADAFPNRSVQYHFRDRMLPVFLLPTTAWGISRRALDHRVARSFAEAGGDLRTGTRGPENESAPGRVFAAGRPRRAPLWVGLKVHLRGLDLRADLEVHLGERAYLGISRVENGAINLCGLFGPRPIVSSPNLIFDYLAAAGLNDLLQRLRRAEIDPSSCCVSAASLGDRRCAPADRVRIGDACATIPPFTGNGLAMAMQGAELALAPLRDYAEGRSSWPEAAQRIGRAQRRAFRRRLAVSAWLHPFFIRSAQQTIFAAVVRSRLLPMRLLYSAVH